MSSVKAVLALALVLWFWPGSRASAERYAIAIGNNAGDNDEETLRWAEDDALHTHALLSELGDVAPEHALLLRGTDADAVRSALRELRARLAGRPHRTETVLFAYFSGHGDAESLHLAGTRLPLREFDALLRELDVGTLITIVDACRDGAAGVRAKGARHAQPFDIQLWRDSGRNGHVTITSAGQNEVAQESDQLRSSFFTHHLLSGMRGAADRDGDHEVSLDELYRYAYHHTLASSHAHLAAVQHPQLEVELQGEGELVITRLSNARALLELPAAVGGDYLIVDDASGEVVAQVYKPSGAEAQVALEPGRFRVQVRQQAAIYAAEIGLEWGGQHALRSDQLLRQEFGGAQNKGGHFDRARALVFAGASVARPSVSDEGPAWGAAARAAWDLPGLRVLGTAQLSTAQGTNDVRARDYFETRIGAGIGPRFMLAPFHVYTGLGAGLLWVHERSTRVARDDAARVLGVPQHTTSDALGPYLAPGASLELPFGGFVAALHGELQLSLLRIDRSFQLRPSPGVSLSIGRAL